MFILPCVFATKTKGIKSLFFRKLTFAHTVSCRGGLHRKLGLIYYIADRTLTVFLAGPVNLRKLLKELGKSALQTGIVDVDAGKLLALVMLKSFLLFSFPSQLISLTNLFLFQSLFAVAFLFQPAFLL